MNQYFSMATQFVEFYSCMVKENNSHFKEIVTVYTLAETVGNLNCMKNETMQWPSSLRMSRADPCRFGNSCCSSTSFQASNYHRLIRVKLPAMVEEVAA